MEGRKCEGQMEHGEGRCLFFPGPIFHVTQCSHLYPSHEHLPSGVSHLLGALPQVLHSPGEGWVGARAECRDPG